MIIRKLQSFHPPHKHNTDLAWLSSAVIETAELGDGWMQILSPDDTTKIALDKLNNQLDNLNRSRDDFGIEAWLRFHENDPEAWAKTAMDGEN